MSEQRPRIAVVTFPGSNDDGDARLALEHLGAEATAVWHATTELDSDIGGVVLPGGFSYGDYLRCGALARSAPVMDAVRGFAVSAARVGRLVDLEIAAMDEVAARGEVQRMCAELLANPLIESFEIVTGPT